MSRDISSNADQFIAFCRKHMVRWDAVAVIAFDVFDTLLYRTVSPQQVYTLWAKALIEEYSLKKTPAQVLKARSIASRMAKLRQVLKGNDREAKYGYMAGMLRILLGISCPKQSFLATCLRLELEVERSVTYVPEERRALLQSAMATGKPVVCISDLYLPVETLRELLTYHNLCPSQLFVSETYALQKATGRLYGRAVELLSQNPACILMIGDNRRSDYEAAREAGLQAVWLKRDGTPQSHGEPADLTQQDARTAFFRSLSSKEAHAPFQAVAYLMVLFTQRLYQKLKQDGCEDALFLAREGEFFQRFFDAYQEQCIPAEDRIKTHYFYVSRKATLLPSIHTVEKDSFYEIFKNYPAMDVMTFLKNLGMEQERTLIELLEQKMDVHHVVPQFLHSEELEQLLQTAEFRQILLAKAQRQRQLLTQYLDAMELGYRTQGLYVVDIGYSGTTQNNLVKSFGDSVTIYGYYLVLKTEPDSISKNSRKTGILYDSQTAMKTVFGYNPVILEAIFMASHGGVLEYTDENGTVLPRCNEDPQERRCYETIVSPLQERIYKRYLFLIQQIQRAGLSENEYDSLFCKAYKQFIFNPTEEELLQYSAMVVQDNFSAFVEKKQDDSRKRTGERFSIQGCWRLLKSKGFCLNEQGTNWMALAFYNLNMRCMNPIMQHMSPIVARIYDYGVRKSVQMRHRRK